MKKNVTEYLKREKELQSRRIHWESEWQRAAEYVHLRKADFQQSREPGAFIGYQLWTDDPIHMAETSSSAFLGYVWGSGVKSFKLKGNSNIFEKDKEMIDFWAEATEILQNEMADQDAGLAVTLDETMLDLVTFGTDAVYIEERNTDNPQLGCLRFEPWSVMNFALAEGVNNKADTFYRRKEYTIKSLVETYGLENVSKESRDAFKEGKDINKRIKVLHIIEPRLEKYRVENSKAAKDMPWASIHIEIDRQKILRESGFPELPVACARLSSRVTEEYGRGFAMNAIPSIMKLNQVWEDYFMMLEQGADPAMYQLHDCVTGSGYIDASAGAVNVLRVDKAQGNFPPVGKLFDMQDPRFIPEVIQKLTDTISQHFKIDRLIDLNNDTQMTRGEAFLRNNIRQSTLRSPVSRLLLEKFDPIINVSFQICLRRNKFGYFPGDPVALAMENNGKEVKYLPQAFLDALEAEEDLFDVDYLTPAARDMMSEEGQGMVEMLQLIGQGAGFDQNLPKRIDWDWTLTRLSDIKGADKRMWRDDGEVQQEIQKEQEAMQQQQQMQLAQMAANVAGSSSSNAQG